MKKRTASLSFIFLFPALIFGQQPVRSFDPGALSTEYYSGLKDKFGKNKEYPQQFRKQILLALSYYPELENISIRFRIKQEHTPLTTRSSWASLLDGAQKREYVITISSASEKMLTAILFENLPFNAQVGVIGHELGHVVEFSSMSTLQILKHGASNVSSKYIDHFEFKTDSICIAHGLGYQLLAWSTYVRTVMQRKNWDGADNVHKPMTRERYMNPSTIEKRISQLPLYHNLTVGNPAGVSFYSITHDVRGM